MQFIFGRELTEGELYDRKEELNLVVNSYATRQPLAIIGFRRNGKSSILNASKSILEEMGILVIKFNLEGISNLNDYSRRFIDSMLKELSKRYKIKYYKEELKKFINMFLGSISQINVRLSNLEFSFDRYNDYIENRIKASEILENILDMPEKLAEDLNENIVVIIDEFQYVRTLKQPFPEILRLLRSKFNSHIHVQYIISGSEVGILDQLLNSKNEPFYAFFRTLEIKPFTRQETIDFLKAGFKSYSINCEIGIIEKIYEVTRGIPAWLNLAGIDLVESKCDVSRFLNDSTYKNIINYELKNLTKNEMLVLRGLSMDMKVSEIIISNKFRILTSLIKKGIIIKEDKNYRISDNLIRYCILNN